VKQIHATEYKNKAIYIIQFNVSERNSSDCKYVEIFTHRVGSIGAPSRMIVSIRGTNTKQLIIILIIIIIIIAFGVNLAPCSGKIRLPRCSINVQHLGKAWQSIYGSSRTHV
jgi:hypothetical protein